MFSLHRKYASPVLRLPFRQEWLGKAVSRASWLLQLCLLIEPSQDFNSLLIQGHYRAHLLGGLHLVAMSEPYDASSRCQQK